MAYSFQPGDYIYIQDVSYTDHPKYHLVLSVTEDYYFVINSEINSTVSLNPEWEKCQVKIKKEPNNKFLTKDCSYIACHQLMDEVFAIEIEEKIRKKKAEVVGRIDKETLNKVIDIVENNVSRTLALYERKEILKELKKI